MKRSASLVTMFIASGTFLVLAFLLSTAGDASSEYGGPVEGFTSPAGWHIEDGDNVTYRDMDILLNGDLIIEEGGILNFEGVTMYSNSRGDKDTAIVIEVREGGLFDVHESTITAAIEVDEHKGNQPFRYKFFVYGCLNLTDSTVQYMWGEIDGFMIPGAPLPGGYSVTVRGGIETYSDDVFIDNSVLTQGQSSGVCIMEGSPHITDSQFISNGHHGLTVPSADSAAVIENCLISNNEFHGIYIRSPNVIFRDNLVSDNGWMGMILSHAGKVGMENCEISGNDLGAWVISSEPEFSGCTFDNGRNLQIVANSNVFLVESECDIEGGKASVDENCSVSHCHRAWVLVLYGEQPVPDADVIVKGNDGNFTWTRNFTVDENGTVDAFAATIQRYHEEWHNMSEFEFFAIRGQDSASIISHVTGDVKITLDIKKGSGNEEPGDEEPDNGKDDDDDDDFLPGFCAGAVLLAVVVGGSGCVYDRKKRK